MSTNSIDYGVQLHSFDYRSEARAVVFNKLFYNLLPYGIYSGGRLEYIDSVSVLVNPMTVLIESNEGENDGGVAVKIDTTETQVVSLALTGSPSVVDEVQPYIILRFGWSSAETNYMEIIRSSWANILPTDIILGKVNFAEVDGAFIIDVESPFDLSRRQDVLLKETEAFSGAFAVRATEPNSNKVSVSGGVIATSTGKITKSGVSIPAEGITPTTEFGRVDIIGIDSLGEFVYVEGQATASPTAPAYENLKVLVEVTLPPNTTEVKGSYLTPVNDPSVVQGPVSPELTPIEGLDDKFPVTSRTITSAIDWLWRHSLVLNPDGAEIDEFKVVVNTDLNHPLGALYI